MSSILNGGFGAPGGTTGPTGPTGATGAGFNISNPFDNRILTSDGSSDSANAESNLTYDGYILSLKNTEIQDVKNLDLYPTSGLSAKSGKVYFDFVEKSLSYYPEDGINVIVKTGNELYVRAKNSTGSTIFKGSAVKFENTSSGVPEISLTLATKSYGDNQIIGLIAEDILDGYIGYVVRNGKLSGIDLSSYNEGDDLYLSDTIPGSYVAGTSSLKYSSRTNKIGYVLDNTSSGSILLDINNEDINLSLTDIERNILEGNVISTGTYSFSGITKASSTTFNVGEVKGWIVNNTGIYAENPQVIHISYPGEVNVTDNHLLTSDSTYLLIDSSGSLIQQPNFPSPQERRENIFIGKTVHPDRTSILNANNTVDYDVSAMSTIRDLFTPIKLINQGIIASPSGSSKSFNVSSGFLWGNGINWTSNQLNPNRVSFSAQSPATFQYRTQNGGIFSDTTIIDVNHYDNSGVVTLVGGGAGSSTNQRIYAFSTGSIRVQYGQTVYSSLAAAVTSAQTESFIEYSNNRDNGILIGILSVNKNATNLSDSTQAVFQYVSKFGEILGGTVGLSTTTLQQAYDNSIQPEIVTNSSLGAITFRRGSLSDSDNVIEVQNAIGTNNFYVDGTGKTTTNALTVSGISSSTGLTKVVVVDDNGNTFYETGIAGTTGPTGPTGAAGAGGALGYYGSFYDTTTQNNAGATAANAMTFDSFYEKNGVRIVSSGGKASQITFDYSGTYNLQFSALFTHPSSNSSDVDIWLAKNGNNLLETNTQFAVAGQAKTIASWNFLLSVNAGDYLELLWSSSDTGMYIAPFGTQINPTRPAVPSIILTAQQVMYTQVGPNGATGATGPTGPTGATYSPTGASSQLLAGDGSLVTVDGGLTLSGATLSTNSATSGSLGVIQLTGDFDGTATSPTVAKIQGVAISGTPSAGQVLTASSASAAAWAAAGGVSPGTLPSGGLFNWLLSGPAPFSNTGSGGSYAPIVGANCNTASAELWRSTRTAIRGYAVSSEYVAKCSDLDGTNTGLSIDLKSSSFTMESYCQINSFAGPTQFGLFVNDDGVGQNTLYLLPTQVQIGIAGSYSYYSVTTPTGRPIHIAVVLDRSNPSAVVLSVYFDGVTAFTQNLGSIAAFSTAFNQFSALAGASGTVGWMRLTASALTAEQVRANTLLLKSG